MRRCQQTARRPIGLCVTLFWLLLPGSAQAERWWSEDKAHHLGLSFALGGGVYAALWSLSDHPPPLRAALATGLSLLPGFGKELYDASRTSSRFSGPDMVFNATGALAGSLSGWLVEHLLTSRPPASLGLALFSARREAVLTLRAPW